MLCEKGLPTFENLIFFRNLSELSDNFLETYGSKKVWAIAGQDDRVKLEDNPYAIKKFRALPLEKDLLEKEYSRLNNEMARFNIPRENRIFAVWKCFGKDNTTFTGIAWYTDNHIFFDIFEGLRPSGDWESWTPHYSEKIPIINGRAYFGSLVNFKYEDVLRKIASDILFSLFQGAYLDFAMTDEVHLLYHDLSLH
ncbi:MAG: hypothetical protein KKD18_04430 [Nanoarchaeota archaeon]|nr:hypothetical protein [Nanoarchaeota archaeon]